jgi:hypothetical protein
MFHHHLSPSPPPPKPPSHPTPTRFRNIFVKKRHFYVKTRLRNFKTLKNTLNSSLEFFLWAFMFLHHPAPPQFWVAQMPNAAKQYEKLFSGWFCMNFSVDYFPMPRWKENKRQGGRTVKDEVE